jgi:hypothetical protein
MARTTLRGHHAGDGFLCSFVLQNLGAVHLDRVRFEDNVGAQGAIYNGGDLRGTKLALVENAGSDDWDDGGGVGLRQGGCYRPAFESPSPSTFLAGVEIRDNVHADYSGQSPGAGVNIRRGTVHLVDAVIERNQVVPSSYSGPPPDFPTFGGGAYIGGGHLILERSVVTRNVASIGGGIYNAAGALTLIDTNVVDNTPDDCVGAGCPADGQ